MPHLQKRDADLKAELTALDADLLLLERANDPTATFLPDAEYEELQNLLNRLEKVEYQDETGSAQPLLTIEEKDALSIRRGSLTREEYQQVQDHAQMSYNFLHQIPWTEEMEQIPHIAFAHHEKLDGSGYPRGLKDEQIPLQARIMTVADIYDALTASDQAYKKAMPVERAFIILREEASRGQLDNDLVELFISREVHKYAEITRPVTETEFTKNGLWWKRPLHHRPASSGFIQLPDNYRQVSNSTAIVAMIATQKRCKYLQRFCVFLAVLYEAGAVLWGAALALFIRRCSFSILISLTGRG